MNWEMKMSYRSEARLFGFGACCMLPLLALAALCGGRTAWAGDSFFDVVTQTPVNLGLAVETDVFKQDFGQVQPNKRDFRVAQTVTEVVGDGGQNVLAIQNASPPGNFAVDSFFDIAYLAGTEGDYPVDSFFDITYRVSVLDPDSDDDSIPVLAAPPSSGFTVDSFFDIDYRVGLTGGGGAGGATGGPYSVLHTLNLDGGVGPGLALTDLSLSSDFTVDSFFDITYRVAVTDPGQLDFGQPVVHMVLTGTNVPEPASAVLLAMAGVSVCVLSRRR
jgi:hypothetical protein